MTRRVREVIAREAAVGFVGRAGELQSLLTLMGRGGPSVVHIHGIGGIGKSSLLSAFANRARGHGLTVVQLDCRAVEPTQRGFLQALSGSIGGNPASAEDASERLGSLGDTVVLVLDAYEVFRLLDTWIRQEFVPSLEEHVSGHVARINRFARGHPLALKLAAAAASESSEFHVEDRAGQRIIEQLTEMYLAEVNDPSRHRSYRRAAWRQLRSEVHDAGAPELWRYTADML